MRSFVIILASAALSGCLTTFKPSPDEICATTGQIYEGFTVTGEVKGDAVGHVRCARPKTEKDECLVVAHGNAARSEDQHNGWAKPRNFVIGAGYTMAILPGYLALKHWEDEDRERVAALRKAEAEQRARCEKTGVAH